MYIFRIQNFFKTILAIYQNSDSTSFHPNIARSLKTTNEWMTTFHLP